MTIPNTSIKYVPFSSLPLRCPVLSKEEKKYVKELVSIQPVKSILTDENVRKKCKDLGQKIFDEFKNQANKNSSVGKRATEKICNAVHFEGKDGPLRKQYIERAWHGIGDENCQWVI